MGTGPLAAAVAGVTVKREADAPLARVSESVPLVLHLAQVASSGTQHGEKAAWATHQIAELSVPSSVHTDCTRRGAQACR